MRTSNNVDYEIYYKQQSVKEYTKSTLTVHIWNMTLKVTPLKYELAVFGIS
jgi:hypothetical protein